MDVLAPVPGRAMPLTEVPDPVFAGAMVGPGMGIDPTRGPITAVAPIAGQLVKLHPHAYVIQGEQGAVLVHLGIDTVQLKGEGFTLHVEENATVAAGQDIVTWDPAAIEAGGKSPAVPVVALEGPADGLAGLVEAGDVAAGDRVFTWG
jgi:glucose-specific phosphotransferase system IIA component